MMQMEVITKPMRQLSLILQEEAEEVRELIFNRLSNIVQEGISTCISENSMIMH
jgi:hypothetical protein